MKPLSLREKLIVIVTHAGPDTDLTNCEFRVLVHLVQRQNPHSGQCNPSVEGLMRDTGFCERSVRGALTILVKKGVIKRMGKARFARNRFIIFPADERALHARLRSPAHGADPSLDRQDAAENHAADCRSGMQPAAPKKRKEKRNEKKDGRNGSAVSREPVGDSPGTKRQTIGFSQFEAKVATVFEKEGIGYAGLLSLPADAFVATYKRYANEVLTFSQAVDSLLRDWKRNASEEAHSGKGRPGTREQ